MATNKHPQTPSGKKKTKKKGKPNNSVEIASDSKSEQLSDMHADTLIRLTEPEQGRSLTPFSLFAVEKFLQCRVGAVKSVKKLQSGALSVEVASNAQAANLIPWIPLSAFQ